MARQHDPILERIRAFDRAKGGGIRVERLGKGYSLFSTGTGSPVARLRPTGADDTVEVLWRRRERWVPFGRTVLPLNQALALIAAEPAFWIGGR